MNQIIIELNLRTDGDYSLRKLPPEFDKYVKVDYEGYYIFLKINKDTFPVPHSTWSEDSYIRYIAKSFLENVATKLDISSIHFYLMRDFYFFFRKAIDFVNGATYANHYQDEIGGSYEGTRININVS